MVQLSLKIIGLSIEEKESVRFVVKCPDPRDPAKDIRLEYSNEREDDEDTAPHAQWTAAIDPSSTALLSNPQTLQIHEIVARKDGSTAETPIGSTSINLISFLFGEIEIKEITPAMSADGDDIGTVEWISTVDRPLFDDPEIDGNNFLSIRIGAMKGVPSPWADVLSSDTATESKDSKKSKKKQEPAPRHWLQCECVFFPEDVPSVIVNIVHKNPPTIIDAADDSSESDAPPKRYEMDWNFASKRLVTAPSMKALIKRFKAQRGHFDDPTIRIVHKFEEMDEVKEDSLSISAEIPIQSLFEGLHCGGTIKLNGPDPAGTLEFELSFETKFKAYCDSLEKGRCFGDIFPAAERSPTEPVPDGPLSFAKESVDEMVRRLTEEHEQFMASTTVQRYDTVRSKDAFVYHLNASGVYREITDKLVRPGMLRHLEANRSWNSSFFTDILGAMTRSLSQKVGARELEEDQATEEEDGLSVAKNTQIATSFEITGMTSKALIHSERALETAKTMNPNIRWAATQNFVQILQKENKADQALSVLTEFVRDHSHHHHSLLYLTALSIESGSASAKAIAYELCDRHPIPTSLTMKAVYFALNGEELRGEINMKRAILGLRRDSNSNLIQDLFGVLFELKCLRSASCILSSFQKLERIDIDFHANNAKLDAASGRFGTAMSSIQEAIRIDDELPELWAIRGHIEFDSAKLDRAKQSYETYLRLIPGTAESLLPRPDESYGSTRLDDKALYRLGKLYEDENAHRLSLRTYFQAIEFDPEGGSWLFWYEAGNALFRLDDYAQSIQCFEQSNLINNNEPHSWCILGLCYLATNAPKTAIKMMKEALKFGTDNISQPDLQRIADFGASLEGIGHIQSGKYFKNAVRT